ncbi:hypothetical protein HPP92_016586 [Vanilla planifolia]|uniref:CASP-like protein n=1 Tax=Vanilla planifolia TaxID=51239 RepID=A0A835QF28_VANPL|nr:hypothetical protein HPP92_017179 [Vanilla planifolia]KAG0472040.1 hypothetical protein HPP92_016586 [Vanilla planifolia]
MASPKASPNLTPTPAYSTNFRTHLALRSLLFGTTAAAAAAMVTSKQAKSLHLSITSPPVVIQAKFTHSPAFVYFVAATLVACVYSLVTAAGSAISLLKSQRSTKTLFVFALLDAVMLGVAASALGAGASIGYVGEKGNSHAGWSPICGVFGEFCKHVGASLVLSMLSSIIVVFLVVISIHGLYRRSL